MITSSIKLFVPYMCFSGVDHGSTDGKYPAVYLLAYCNLVGVVRFLY